MRRRAGSIAYREETPPVKDFYRREGVHVEIDGHGEVDDVQCEVDDVQSRIVARVGGFADHVLS